MMALANQPRAHVCEGALSLPPAKKLALVRRHRPDSSRSRLGLTAQAAAHSVFTRRAQRPAAHSVSAPAFGTRSRYTSHFVLLQTVSLKPVRDLERLCKHRKHPCAVSFSARVQFKRCFIPLRRRCCAMLDHHMMCWIVTNLQQCESLREGQGRSATQRVQRGSRRIRGICRTRAQTRTKRC